MKNSDTDRFFEGEEVHQIFWSDEGSVTVGQNGCEKITFIVESGQLAEIPWFAIKYNGASTFGRS